MMNGRTEISITQRVAKLDAEICGDEIKKKMIREAARYAKDVRDYIKTGAISNEMKVGTKEDGGYLVPDEMAAGLVEALEDPGQREEMRRSESGIQGVRCGWQGGV